jgi:hypothetical protein
MVATNRNEYLPSVIPGRLVNSRVEAVQPRFDQQPANFPAKLLFEALRREVYFRQQRRAEDIRIHAWLDERLAAARYEQHGWWPRLQRFLSGNRLLAWLGFHPSKDSQ